MKKWFVLLLMLPAFPMEGMVPLPQTSVPMKTEVKVKSEKQRTRKNEYSAPGYRTAVKKNTSQSVFLSIEVQSMSPKPIKDLRISYRFYELQFERSSGNRLVFARRWGTKEKLVPSSGGQLTIEELKPLEKKVVESESLETSYGSETDTTKIISQTRTTGSKYGGYIVEYFVEGKLVKWDASSRRLLEAYARSRQAGGSTSGGLKMNVRH
jgi:hypothetical protein